MKDVNVTVATRCRVSNDSHPRQSSQLLCLYPAGGRSQGARSHHGLSPRRFWLYRVQSRGDTVIVWALDRGHNYTILPAGQVGKSIDLIVINRPIFFFKFCITTYISLPWFINAALFFFFLGYFQEIRDLVVSWRLSRARTWLGVWQTNL